MTDTLALIRSGLDACDVTRKRNATTNKEAVFFMDTLLRPQQCLKFEPT